MANYKYYYVSQADFDREIKNAKMPHQQLQLYTALAKLGKPTRGADIVDQAKKTKENGGEGLITRQASDVLAAWYFSEKRRYAYPIKVSSTDTPINEDPKVKRERLARQLSDLEVEIADLDEQIEAAESVNPEAAE
jgi:hypothetical protein